MRATTPSGIGLYLGVVQFFFALCWTVYVVFLPQLAAQAGIAKSAVIWILLVDQLVFAVVDYAMGVASDAMAAVVGRVGRAVLGVTLLSCMAFLALPFVAPQGSPALFLAVVLLWSASSSALRAPPLMLVGRHAARPQRPVLVALSLMGLGVAGAASPYLAVHLRGIDPRMPFVLASAALALATLGIVAAERSLSRATALDERSASVDRAPAGGSVPPVAFLLPALLAALAFQVHAVLNSEPLYRRLASPGDLPFLSPVFWIGFNLFLLPASIVVRPGRAVRTMGTAALVAAAAALAAREVDGLSLLVAAQLAAGAAWAALLTGAFAAALDLGHRGREGRYSGALASALAAAAVLRIAVVALGWNRSDPVPVQWLPIVAWTAAGVVLLALSVRVVRPRPAARPAPRPAPAPSAPPSAR